LTKVMERYTAGIPSSAYLAVALGAMGLSFLFQLGGRGKWGNFVAQWVPTWLIIGLYNKVVKIEGHDRDDRAPIRRDCGPARPAVGISNRDFEEEQRSRGHVPPRGQGSGT
jgi:hypothetical protein